MKNKQLIYEIKCMEDIIKGKEARGVNADFEKRLVRAWKRYLDRPTEASSQNLGASE